MSSINCIDGVMVSVLASRAVDCMYIVWSSIGSNQRL